MGESEGDGQYDWRSGYAIEFGVGSSKELKSREWVGCEHSMYEGVEKDGTRTLMHGSVGTHCTARTRVCGVKMRRRVIHVAGVRQVGQHRYRQCANQPTLRESAGTPSRLRLHRVGEPTYRRWCQSTPPKELVELYGIPTTRIADYLADSDQRDFHTHDSTVGYCTCREY